jgi:hypothetical protein
MEAANPSAAQTRAQDAAFVAQCSYSGLRPRLPLQWSVPEEVPASPKRQYRSHYVYQGSDDLDDLANWEHLSPFDLALRLVDFSPLRPLLAWLLGWTSARGRVPFDPVSIFLFVGWQLANGWKRSTALNNLKAPRYADYARRFGFHDGHWPTEGGIRYFLTTLGIHSHAHGETISVAMDETRSVEVAVQYLNYLLAGSVGLVRQAQLISPATWQAALVCPDGQIHNAASRMRCTSVQAACYQPTSSEQPRPCAAKEKGKRGCDCDTAACAQVCCQAPSRDPQARTVYYAGANQPHHASPNAPAHPAPADAPKGELYYGYRSLPCQFAEWLRRYSMVLLDDTLSANDREENPSAAELLLLHRFYPDLVLAAAAGDAGLGYYAFLHTSYTLGAKRVVDLRAEPGDQDKPQWTVRGYDDRGRPICPYGYALTANGYDPSRRRHKWFCGQACLHHPSPQVQLSEVSYPPQECPYQDPATPHGKIVNVGETFADGSIRLARDLPVGSPTWKALYHRARNAVEDRNADLEQWGLKRLPVYGQPRARALIALADTWLNLTTLARLVREATFAASRQLS